MLKLLLLFTFCVTLIPLGYGQQPILIVKDFDYIRDRDDGTVSATGQKRVILAENDSINHLISARVVKAFQNRWNIVMPEVLLSVKPLGLLSLEPKFSTKIKDKSAGNWYLFLQFFDKRSASFSEEDKLWGSLTVKCRLIDGANDSVIHERDLLISFYKEPTPPDQITLLNLPGYPPSYVQAFDSIAEWIFQPEVVTAKAITIKPACIFAGPGNTINQPIQPLAFQANKDTIIYTGAPDFAFYTGEPLINRTDARRNRGANIASGALTLVTGAGTSKSRQFDYAADFLFKEKDTAYHCIVNYTEHETGNRERVKDDFSPGYYNIRSNDYGIQDRFIDTSSLNFIRLGNDTMAVFTIRYEKVKDAYSGYYKCWDGKDSSTIISMQDKWNNRSVQENVVIAGHLDSIPFTIKAVKEKKEKEFYVNNTIVAILYGKNFPAFGYAYQPISERQLKVFTILSSLPYANFNVHYSN